MKNKLLKAVSLLLTVSMLIISASFVSSAAETQYIAYLEASGDSVELDGTNAGTVTVSLVTKEALTCYGIEGIWDTTGGDNEYLKLTGISSDVLEFEDYNYANAGTGKVMWADEDLTGSGKINAGEAILTATYSVAANTPEGQYTVSFHSEAFTGTKADPEETEKTFEATITVKHHKPTMQDGKAATCEEDGWNAYYKCPVCGKFYSDAEGKNEIPDLDAWKVGAGKVPATNHLWGEPSYTDKDGDTHTANYVCANDESHTKSDEPVAHDFTNGECVCGAKEPVTGLKGDVNLDGQVTLADAVALTRHVTEVELLTDATAIKNADVNGDGELSLADAVKLTRYTLDLETLD